MQRLGYQLLTQLKMCITSDSPKASVVPQYPQGLVPGTPRHADIGGCSSPLSKMA